MDPSSHGKTPAPAELGYRRPVLRNPVVLLRGLPATVRILVAGTFINKLGSFIIPFLTIVLKREFHLSGTEVGALVMAYGAGSLVSVLCGGVLTDRLGRRATLLLSLFGSGAAAVALGFSPSIRVFATLLVLFGFVADLYRPYGTIIVLDRCHDLAVYHDIKTGVVVLEYASEGRVVPTGAPYINRYISVLTIIDRKVTHWRDYLDPVAVFDALGWPSR